MTDLPARLRALADSLEGDDWEHPLLSKEACREAADALESLAEELEAANLDAHAHKVAHDKLRYTMDGEDAAAIQSLEQEYAEYWTIEREGGDWCVWDCYGQHGDQKTCIGKSPNPARAIAEAAEACVRRGRP